MNEVPPGQEGPDEADDLYRRASALDESRPSELVRRRVLRHAAQLAAKRSVRAASRRWRQPAIFGTLAAAALAGLLVTPRFFTPDAPPTAALQSTAALPPSEALPPTAVLPPTGALPAAPTLPPAAGPAVAARPTHRIPGPPEEITANNSQAKLQNTDSARSKAAASDASQGGALPQPMAPPAAARPDQVVASTATTQAGAPSQFMAPSAAARHSADPAAELRRAAEIGDIPGLERLLDQQSLIEARDESGRTALILAALHGQSHAVDVLLAHGADPNAADGQGITPLQAAVAANQPAIVAALQRAGAR